MKELKMIQEAVDKQYVYVVSPISGDSYKRITSLDKAYEYMQHSTDSVYKMDKRIFNSLYKDAKASYFRNPIKWAFHRYINDGNEYSTL